MTVRIQSFTLWFMSYKPLSFDYSPAVLLCPVISWTCSLLYVGCTGLSHCHCSPLQSHHSKTPQRFRAKGRTSDGLSSVCWMRVSSCWDRRPHRSFFIVAASSDTSLPLRHCLRMWGILESVSWEVSPRQPVYQIPDLSPVQLLAVSIYPEKVHGGARASTWALTVDSEGWTGADLPPHLPILHNSCLSAGRVKQKMCFFWKQRWIIWSFTAVENICCHTSGGGSGRETQNLT